MLSPQSRGRSARRLIPPAVAVLLALLIAVPSSGTALAQSHDGIVLVNADRDFIERKKEGEFIARPVFDSEIETLFYAVRDADTGEWISTMYRVVGGIKRMTEGWEHSWEYPAFDQHPDLDPEKPYLLVMLAVNPSAGETAAFYAVIPVHQPGGLWDRVLGALEPSRWARAFARWVIEGVHGTLCGVVERASGSDADECGGG
ncbi:MAG: hypothetical protein F4Z29_13245 [Gemmatimonadetes bacterium]|nr:hypothetical protein [Gemmatimonadota bacterium]